MSFERSHMPSDSSFQAQVRNVCGVELRQIDDSHRLVWQSADQHVLEMYSSRYGRRVIAMPVKSAVFESYTRLLHEKQPVFSGFATEEGVAILEVPEGAKPVANLLPAIARRTSEYGFVFIEIGKVLRNLYEIEEGVPINDSNEGILSSLAFAIDEESTQGGKLFLVPPFNFDKNMTPRDVSIAIQHELAQSSLFSRNPAAIEYLARCVEEGMHSYDTAGD